MRMRLIALAKRMAKPDREAIDLIRDAILFVEKEERDRTRLQTRIRLEALIGKLVPP